MNKCHLRIMLNWKRGGKLSFAYFCSAVSGIYKNNYKLPELGLVVFRLLFKLKIL